MCNRFAKDWPGARLVRLREQGAKVLPSEIFFLFFRPGAFRIFILYNRPRAEYEKSLSNKLRIGGFTHK